MHGVNFRLGQAGLGEIRDGSRDQGGLSGEVSPMYNVLPKKEVPRWLSWLRVDS